MKVRLSLAVAAARVDPDELERFLECLPAAELGPNDQVEIAGTPASVALASTLRDVATHHDRVRLTLHPLGSTPMQLWGFAMARARGEHVGVLDIRAIPVARWRTRILLRADSGFAREDLMAWCEANDVDYLFGLAKNERLLDVVSEALGQAKAAFEVSGQAARRFKGFT